jgi:hypothetical protein
LPLVPILTAPRVGLGDFVAAVDDAGIWGCCVATASGDVNRLSEGEAWCGFICACGD